MFVMWLPTMVMHGVGPKYENMAEFQGADGNHGGQCSSTGATRVLKLCEIRMLLEVNLCCMSVNGGIMHIMKFYKILTNSP